MIELAGFEHVHVTEREVAHMSPCGWDDAKWEDCTFMSALEWWRATGHPEVPATHEEGEELRCASGRSMLGGTNLSDVRKAIAVRYNGVTPAPVAGFARLWSKLTPGTVAVAQGSMGAFPTGSRWRRWSPNFAGSHAVCVYRRDGSDRVWWCDPNAPVRYRSGLISRTYDGEWMSKAEFKSYVDAFNGYHLVAAVVPASQETDMSVTIEILAWEQGTATVNGAGHDLIRLSDDNRTPISAGSKKGTGARVKLLKGARGQEGKEARLVNHGGEAHALLVADTTFEAAPSGEPLPPTIQVGSQPYDKRR